MKIMKKIRNIIFTLLVLCVLAPFSAVNGQDFHWVELGRDLGPAAKLIGDIQLLLVFVSTPEHPWSEEEISNFFDAVQPSTDFIMDEAERYGVPLSLSTQYFEASIPYEFDGSDLNNIDLSWYWYLVKNYFHTDGMVSMHEAYEERFGKNNTPFLFVFNTLYRDITYSADLSHPNWQEEFSINYGQQPPGDNSIAHELMHQYGAVDLYDLSSEGVEKVSEQIFPDSVMLSLEGTEIDELTAYLIGWIDDPAELSDDTLYFLTATDGLRKSLGPDEYDYSDIDEYPDNYNTYNIYDDYTDFLTGEYSDIFSDPGDFDLFEIY